MKDPKYSYTCAACEKDGLSSAPNQKLCSETCRNTFYGKEPGKEALPPSTVGAVSEMITAVDLMKKGYSVFRALSPSCYCDLIAVKGTEKLELEVRTATKGTNGNLNYSSELSKYDVGNVNSFAVVVKNGNEVLYFDLNKNKLEI